MSDQSRIQTLGPADPNAPLMQKVYALLSLLGVLVSGASTFGIITSEQAASLGQVSSTGTVFVTALGLAAAAFRTKKQLGNGTFDKAPDPVVVSKPQLSLDDVRVVRDELDSVITTTAARAEDNLNRLAGLIPGGGAAANIVKAGPVGDLVQGVADLLGDRVADLLADRRQ
ncbi:hypothetical protein BH11ACT6_BH11ACT6_35050 [soil metagenome]